MDLPELSHWETGNDQTSGGDDRPIHWQEEEIFIPGALWKELSLASIADQRGDNPPLFNPCSPLFYMRSVMGTQKWDETRLGAGKAD